MFIAEQWLLFSILAVLAAALVFVEGQRSGDNLSFYKVTLMLNKDEAVLVDVRESKEYSAGHIVDAINIPHTKVESQLNLLEKHKEKTVIVVDKMGQHSGSVAKTLKEKGFQVARLQGGMTEWTSQNLPVVKS